MVVSEYTFFLNDKTCHCQPTWKCSVLEHLFSILFEKSSRFVSDNLRLSSIFGSLLGHFYRFIIQRILLGIYNIFIKGNEKVAGEVSFVEESNV